MTYRKQWRPTEEQKERNRRMRQARANGRRAARRRMLKAGNAPKFLDK